MSTKKYTYENAEEFLGHELGVSGWLEVGQDSISAFGHVTHDPDPNHIDPEWARQHSPYGCTIAFGFQTLSLLTFLCKEAGIKPEGIEEEYNYGIDSARFIGPVPAGARVRARCSLKGVRTRGPHHKVLTVAVQVDVEGEEKPALVADWLVMVGNGGDQSESLKEARA
jgi:acyl dehydratase